MLGQKVPDQNVERTPARWTVFHLVVAGVADGVAVAALEDRCSLRNGSANRAFQSSFQMSVRQHWLGVAQVVGHYVGVINNDEDVTVVEVTGVDKDVKGVEDIDVEKVFYHR